MPDITNQLGTGERHQQLSLLSSYERRWPELSRARACEQEAVALYAQEHSSAYPIVRFQRTIPPFLKWPIWRVRPKRSIASPTTFRQLRQYLSGDLDAHGVRVEQSSTFTYRFRTKPYLHLRVTYSNGEVGPDDRRVLVALCHHAQQTSGRRPPHEAKHEIASDELFRLLGDKPTNGARKQISLALWGLAGTFVTTLEGDPLVRNRSWSTESYPLLSAVQVSPAEDSRFTIRYVLHRHATEMLMTENGASTTFDLLRSLALKRNPCAESLYLLLYDCAQWVREDHIDFQQAILGQCLGIARSTRPNDARKTIDRACIIATKIAGCIADYERFGRAESTCYRFYFANRDIARQHSMSDHASTTALQGNADD